MNGEELTQANELFNRINELKKHYLAIEKAEQIQGHIYNFNFEPGGGYNEVNFNSSFIPPPKEVFSQYILQTSRLKLTNLKKNFETI